MRALGQETFDRVYDLVKQQSDNDNEGAEEEFESKLAEALKDYRPAGGEKEEGRGRGARAGGEGHAAVALPAHAPAAVSHRTTEGTGESWRDMARRVSHLVICEDAIAA